MFQRLVLIGLLAIAVSGCATSSAGYRISQEASVREDGRLSIERNEPGLAQAIRGDIRSTDELAVAFVRVPRPLNAWAAELTPDRARVVPVALADGQMAPQPLQKVVARALHIRPDGTMAVFDAVINPEASAYFVLLPPGSRLDGRLVIVSTDARHLLTTEGEVVDLREISEADLERGRLSEDFFAAHPSPAPPLVSMSRRDPRGQQLLEALGGRFSERLVVTFQGRDGSRTDVFYSALPGTSRMLAAYTPLNTFGDRAVTCGSLPLGTGLLAGGPLALAGPVISGIRTLSVGLREGDCLAGRAPRPEAIRRN